MISKSTLSKTLLCLMVMGLAFMPVYGQVKQSNPTKKLNRCGVDEYMQKRFTQNPGLEKQFEDLQKQFVKDVEARIACNASNEVAIPLAFHFDNAFSCGDESCMLSKIYEQIDILNVSFASNLSSPNAANCSSAYQDISSGTCISFYLAEPPSCANTSTTACNAAITIGQFQGGYSGTGNGGGTYGAGSCWDDYLNVFVQTNGSGLGVADQIPDALPADGPGEGVSVTASAFGGTGGPISGCSLDTDNTFSLGATLTHEIGHYLGLFHTFQGGCSDEPNNTYNGSSITVNDTPAQSSPYYGCPSGCVSSGCGGSQQTANIMNYTDDQCMDMFSEDQAFAMNVVANDLFGSLSIPAAGASLTDLLGLCPAGSCQAPSCTDGVQNGNETGVDCGGSCPNVCPPCTDITISITFDNYPEETSWTLTSNGATIGSGGTYGSQADGSTINLSGCLEDGCYTFTINDSYGDGICCSYGSGSYTISDAAGTVYASGGSFGSSEATDFCISSNPVVTGCTNPNAHNYDSNATQDDGSCETCDDGVQNGDETGTDCGGSLCNSCPPNPILGCTNPNAHNYDSNATQDDDSCETCDDGVQNGDETDTDCGGVLCTPCGGGACSDVMINSNDFEGGLGIWNDGGSDCRRSFNDRNYANSGSYCVRLRDNSSSSRLTSDPLNLSNFEDLSIAYSMIAVSMENGEDYFIEINRGSGWEVVANYARGVHFNNNTRYSDEVTVAGPFNSSTSIRFRCDASVNNDRVFFDDVVLTGCQTNAAREVETRNDIPDVKVISDSNLTVYPNPVHDIINVNYQIDGDYAQLQIMNSLGQTLRSLNVAAGTQKLKLNVSLFENGNYFLIIRNNNDKIVKQFIKL